MNNAHIYVMPCELEWHHNGLFFEYSLKLQKINVKVSNKNEWERWERSSIHDFNYCLIKAALQ
jgi:hypothetical protein